jgi:hypothetical protein
MHGPMNINMMKYGSKKWGGGVFFCYLMSLFFSAPQTVMTLFITQVQWRSEQFRRGFTAIVDEMSINMT